jgi:hypothetical protein
VTEKEEDRVRDPDAREPKAVGREKLPRPLQLGFQLLAIIGRKGA